MRENIVVPAWELASSNSILKKFNFLPSFFATSYLGLIVCYQVAWTYIYVFNLKDEFFKMVLDFSHSLYFLEIVVGIVLFIFLYMILSPFAEGGLMALIAKADSGTLEDRPYSSALSVGLRNFLPIFEAQNLMSLFKLLSIITFYIFLLRIFGRDYLWPISIIMWLYLTFSFFVNMLFAYTKYFIVFEDQKAFEAMGRSVTMAIDNIEVTFRLYFTLLLVYVRTLLTVLALIIFPFIISGILTYVTIGFLQMLFIAVAVLLVIAFLLFVSHLNSVLEIFVEALWYHAYKDNRTRMPVATE